MPEQCQLLSLLVTRHVRCRYTDQDYDSEFIEILQTQCFNFIKQAGEASLDEVSAFIHDKVCGTCCNVASLPCHKYLLTYFNMPMSAVDMLITSSSQKLVLLKSEQQETILVS